MSSVGGESACPAPFWCVDLLSMEDTPTQLLLEELKKAFADRDRRKLNLIVSALLQRDAPMGQTWRSLANAMVHNGEYTLAREASRRHARSAGESANARFDHAMILARTGDLMGARDCLADVPANVPAVDQHAYAAGNIDLNLGLFQQAQEWLLAAVRANPRSGQSWLALAMIGDPTTREGILKAEAPMRSASSIEQAQYFYARGAVLVEEDAPAEAFAAFERGAAIVRSNVKPDREAYRRSAVAALAGYDAGMIKEIGERVAVDTSRVVFVTGTPRSGTTLVEQILASHSLVAGGEEIGRLGSIAAEIGGSSRFALDRWCDDERTVDELAELYLHWVAERFGASGLVVDKTPDASRYLGLAASLLPQARFIWVRRDPLDRAWSCFRHYFLRGAAWSYDLGDIAYHFRLEDQLLERWQDLLGNRLLIVDYEALVCDPTPQINRLLRHCALDAEPQVYTPHLTRRSVATASVVQVRKPITTRAIGSSASYRKFLQPFVEAYDGANVSV